MAKRTVTLNVDDELVEAMKERGLNMSDIARRAFRACIQSDAPLFDDFLLFMRLEMYNDILTDLEIKIEKQRRKLEELQLRYEDIKNKKQKIERELELARRAARISELMQIINRVAIECNFNKEALMLQVGDLVEEMKQLKEDFDIDRHLERLKLFSGY